MKTIRFENANIYNTAKRGFEKGSLTIKNGMIATGGTADEVVDCKGAYIIPGMIDIHTHGRAGVDSSNASAEEILKMARSYAKAGTTSFLPTFGTVPLDWYAKAIDSITAARACQLQAVDGADILGIHFEGRYINVKKKGAHDPAHLAPLNPDELAGHIERMQNKQPSMHFHITCAPELEGGEAFVKRAVSMGAAVSIGHSNATMQECEKALEWGAKSFTHLYNAMSPLSHREPGCVGTGLATDAYTELISDGFHVAPAVIRLTQRAKSPDRLVLITDSLPPAGMEPGIYHMGHEQVDTRNGKIAYCMDGVTINGSIIDLFTGLKNFMEFTGLTLEEAIPYANLNPARLIGAADTVGTLEAGKQADFILLKEDKATIDRVYVRGTLIA